MVYRRVARAESVVTEDVDIVAPRGDKRSGWLLFLIRTTVTPLPLPAPVELTYRNHISWSCTVTFVVCRLVSLFYLILLLLLPLLLLLLLFLFAAAIY
jgi:hypothetical protein